MVDWYDRAGNPISLDEWVRLRGTPGYTIVARTDLGPLYVSTVWLGLDHGHGYGGPPIIFETMVFETETQTMAGLSGRPFRYHPEVGIQERYATEAGARAGHVNVVERLRGIVNVVERLRGMIAEVESADWSQNGHTPPADSG